MKSVASFQKVRQEEAIGTTIASHKNLHNNKMIFIFLTNSSKSILSRGLYPELLLFHIFDDEDTDSIFLPIAYHYIIGGGIKVPEMSR